MNAAGFSLIIWGKIAENLFGCWDGGRPTKNEKSASRKETATHATNPVAGARQKGVNMREKVVNEGKPNAQTGAAAVSSCKRSQWVGLGEVGDQ